jgi:hypothetical protein
MVDAPVTTFNALADGEWHSDTHNEKEEGHDNVPESETYPGSMLKLASEPGRQRVGEQLEEFHNKRGSAGYPEHVKPAQRVD